MVRLPDVHVGILLLKLKELLFDLGDLLVGAGVLGEDLAHLEVAEGVFESGHPEPILNLSDHLLDIAVGVIPIKHQNRLRVHQLLLTEQVEEVDLRADPVDQ